MGEAELGHDDLLTRGREALGRGAWSDARDSFERAVALSETPDALEGLGAAAWWQNDAPAVFEAREHAYRLYRRREDRTGAARMASALALDNTELPTPTVVSIWILRPMRRRCFPHSLGIDGCLRDLDTKPRGGRPLNATRTRFPAIIVAVAPAVLLAGLASHPYLPRLPDDAAVAAAVTSDTTRWGLSHLTVAVGSGLIVLAFLAVRSYLREAGEERWSGPALPFVVIGSTLFGFLPGMEFAPLAAAEAGGDVQAAQAALEPWFVPILVTGAITFALGVVGFARGIARSRILRPRLTGFVVGALVVMAAARFVPLGAVQLYVQGAAGIAALWPLAYEMWKQPQARPAERSLPLPAA
jgi:hypothetical protein